MANLASLLSDKIRRVARREIRGQTQKTRRLTAQHRRDLAALKRQVAALTKTVAFLEKQEQRRVASPPPLPQEAKGVRFSARSVKAQRTRLGLSAKDFGRLVGVPPECGWASVFTANSLKLIQRGGRYNNRFCVSPTLGDFL